LLARQPINPIHLLGYYIFETALNGRTFLVDLTVKFDFWRGERLREPYAPPRQKNIQSHTGICPLLRQCLGHYCHITGHGCGFSPEKLQLTLIPPLLTFIW
jgi:hypothetical protein